MGGHRTPERRTRRAAARFRPLALLALALATGAAPVTAQEEIWKAENDRGNRWEGRVEIPVAKPDLELRSFVGLMEGFEGDVDLKVRFFLAESPHAVIEARELRERKKYLMRAKRTEWEAGRWNEFGPWPTREVLVGLENIPAWNLGVRVDVAADGGGNRFAPAFVYHRELPATVESYKVVLRPNRDLRRLEYAVYPTEGERGEPLKTDRLTGEIVAGEPATIEFDGRDLPEAWLTVVFTGKFSGRLDGPEFEFDFFHQPDLAVD